VLSPGFRPDFAWQYSVAAVPTARLADLLQLVALNDSTEQADGAASSCTDAMDVVPTAAGSTSSSSGVTSSSSGAAVTSSSSEDAAADIGSAAKPVRPLTASQRTDEEGGVAEHKGGRIDPMDVDAATDDAAAADESRPAVAPSKMTAPVAAAAAPGSVVAGAGSSISIDNVELAAVEEQIMTAVMVDTVCDTSSAELAADVQQTEAAMLAAAVMSSTAQLSSDLPQLQHADTDTDTMAVDPDAAATTAGGGDGGHSSSDPVSDGEQQQQQQQQQQQMVCLPRRSRARSCRMSDPDFIYGDVMCQAGSDPEAAEPESSEAAASSGDECDLVLDSDADSHKQQQLQLGEDDGSSGAGAAKHNRLLQTEQREFEPQWLPNLRQALHFSTDLEHTVVRLLKELQRSDEQGRGGGGWQYPPAVVVSVTAAAAWALVDRRTAALLAHEQRGVTNDRVDYPLVAAAVAAVTRLREDADKQQQQQQQQQQAQQHILILSTAAPNADCAQQLLAVLQTAPCAVQLLFGSTARNGSDGLSLLRAAAGAGSSLRSVLLLPSYCAAVVKRAVVTALPLLSGSVPLRTLPLGTHNSVTRPHYKQLGFGFQSAFVQTDAAVCARVALQLEAQLQQDRVLSAVQLLNRAARPLQRQQPLTAAVPPALFDRLLDGDITELKQSAAPIDVAKAVPHKRRALQAHGVQPLRVCYRARAIAVPADHSTGMSFKLEYTTDKPQLYLNSNRLPTSSEYCSAAAGTQLRQRPEYAAEQHTADCARRRERQLAATQARICSTAASNGLARSSSLLAQQRRYAAMRAGACAAASRQQQW
jgi:hypothetical protein